MYDDGMEDDERSIDGDLFADEAEESGRSGSEREKDDDKKNSGDEKDKEDATKKKKVKPKKTGPVKRIMLHEEMLIGPNGLTKLEGIFKDFKFGGRGREKDDLDNILYKLEHWIHNIYPRHPFSQTLERIEFLGMKRKVLKTHMKKIRMGLINNFDTVAEDNLPADLGDESDLEMDRLMADMEEPHVNGELEKRTTDVNLDEDVDLHDVDLHDAEVVDDVDLHDVDLNYDTVREEHEAEWENEGRA